MRLFRIMCISLLIIMMAVSLYAAEKRHAEIVLLDGSVDVKRTGSTEWSPASVGMILDEGDTVRTGAKSSILLDIDKGRVGSVDVRQESQMIISELQADPKVDTSKTLLDLAIGEVLIKAKKVHGETSKFEVKTPTSIVGVRGTTFNVKVEAVKE